MQNHEYPTQANSLASKSYVKDKYFMAALIPTLNFMSINF